MLVPAAALVAVLVFDTVPPTSCLALDESKVAGRDTGADTGSVMLGRRSCDGDGGDEVSPRREQEHGDGPSRRGTPGVARPRPAAGPPRSRSSRGASTRTSRSRARNPEVDVVADDVADVVADEWDLAFEPDLHAVAPALHESQNAWLASIDSLGAPDRKTHELIRLVCTVVLRNTRGVMRHARLAAEVGATWEEVAGAIVLTEPEFGLLPAAGALPWARRGWEHGRRAREEAELDDDASGPTSRRPKRTAGVARRPRSGS